MSELAPARVLDGVSAGTLLRRAREEAGLHVAALAVSLKVPVRKLEALEADRYDEMPDAVFIRALASSVCRALQIDPQPILDRLPQSTAPRLVGDADGINVPFRAPGDAASLGWVGLLKQPIPLAVLALLIGALVLFLVPISPRDAVAPAAASPQASTAAVTSAGEAVVVNEPVVAQPKPQAPVATETPVTSTAPAAPAAAVAAVAQLAETRPALASAAAAEGQQIPGATSGIVAFRATGESWVEVTDAKGVVTLRRLLNAGDTAAASGALPLQVIVGRADTTEVLVRGKPYDLKRVAARDNVARFQVK